MLRRGRDRTMAGATLAVLLLLGLFQRAAAQEQETEPRPYPRWVFYEEEIALGLLLDLCSDAFGVPIERGAVKGGGAVSIHPGNYTHQELWEFTNRELVARGFTSVQPPATNALRVVAIADAASLARLEAKGLEGARAGYVKVMVPLEHRTAENLIETVRLLLSKPAGTVSAARETNALLLADFTGHVSQALGVIALLDAPFAAPAIEEVPLEHTTPTGLSSLLERVTAARKLVARESLRGTVLSLPEARSMLVVAPKEELEWWKETIERFDRPEQVTTIEYAPRRFGLAETARLMEAVVWGAASGEAPGSWRVVTDELTGTLIVTTTPSRHREIERLLARLEATEQGPRRPLRAFPIKNRRVSEVITLLQDLLEAGVLDQGAGAEGTPGGVPAEKVQGTTGAIPARSVSPSRAAGPDLGVTLAADEGTSRILAFGEARLLDQLCGLIQSLDVRHAQVLIEVLVVSLNEAGTRNLGMELQAIGSTDGGAFRLASLFGLGSADPFGSTLPPAGGTGFSGAVLDPGDYSALLRALETLNQGRSLTIPKVLVNNNQPAQLDSLLQTPFTSTNASTTVATTSFGGTLDAGTAISVKPQVADGDQIVLEYTVSLSSFVGEASDPNLPPPRQENKLQSVVTIPDGHTVVVGGLEVESDARAESRVPFLGGLPLLGELFKDRSRTRSKTRFFVFLRCSVMRSPSFEDLRYTSRPELAAAGLDDGWPKLEPRIIR